MKTTVSLLLLFAAVHCSASGRLDRLSQAPLLTVSDVNAENVSVTVDDSNRYVTFKLRMDEAPAVRLHLSNLRLAPGDKLYVSSTDGATVLGPIEGSGPNNSGYYSSEPVPGSEIAIEWQAGSRSEGDLPFTVESIEAADVPATSSEPIEHSAREVRTSLYRGVPVAHDVVDGMAVVEGDIVLGRADEMIPATGTALPKGGRSSVGITASRYRWPNGVMPYVIDPAIQNPGRVAAAIGHWNTKMAGAVKMVPRTTESNYVRYARVTGTSDCTSYVGMQASAQTITVSDSCSTGTLIHETGHAWGLWHEHTREDRDKHVTINWNNIKSGQTHNFAITTASGDDLGAYDYGSIMHYATTSYSANGKQTLTTIPPGITVGQRSGLSAGDIAGIKALYPDLGAASAAAAGTPVAITIASSNSTPAIIDGIMYATPATFSWPVGSVHWVSAPDFTLSGGRYTFVSWSNGADQAQQFTVPAKAATIKATYSTSYNVTISKTGTGSTSVTPLAADGYYAKNAAVGVTATPAAGYCFAGWTGLVALTPAETSLTVTKKYALTAKFVSGSLTLSSGSVVAPATGSATIINVTTPAACNWTPIQPQEPWITLSNLSTVAGPGTVTITVAPNMTGAERSAVVTIGGTPVTVNQTAI